MSRAELLERVRPLVRAAFRDELRDYNRRAMREARSMLDDPFPSVRVMARVLRVRDEVLKAAIEAGELEAYQTGDRNLRVEREAAFRWYREHHRRRPLRLVRRRAR